MDAPTDRPHVLLHHIHEEGEQGFRPPTVVVEDASAPPVVREFKRSVPCLFGVEVDWQSRMPAAAAALNPVHAPEAATRKKADKPPTEKLKEADDRLKDLSEEVAGFKSVRDSVEFRGLNDALTKLMIFLDGIDTSGQGDLRDQRRKLLCKAQSLVEELEDKADEADKSVETALEAREEPPAASPSPAGDHDVEDLADRLAIRVEDHHNEPTDSTSVNDREIDVREAAHASSHQATADADIATERDPSGAQADLTPNNQVEDEKMEFE